jgi:hypothetical protein
MEKKKRAVKDVPCRAPLEDITNMSKTTSRVCNVNEKEGETCGCRDAGQGQRGEEGGAEARKEKTTSG